MLKIDKGIPIPEKKQRKDHPYPWKDMEVGDSFVVTDDKPPGDLRKAVMHTLYWYNKSVSEPIKISSRKTKEGLRVWRVK